MCYTFTCEGEAVKNSWIDFWTSAGWDAACEDGTTIAIYDCKGLCSSQPREFVECIGQSQTLTKSYGGTGDGVQ